MQGNITGINKTSLWQAWKDIRSELRHATVRDIVDFLDYDIEPGVWIGRLLRQVKEGTYEPHPPGRFTLAKSGGFTRTLTIPFPQDLALFRAAASFVHRKAHKNRQPHVYYRRVDLQRAIEAAARDDFAHFSDIYRVTSAQSFRNWLDYNQYRRRLILKRIFPYIVITDITNFFDTVLHSEIANAFRNFPIPSRLIGILFFLMERFAIRADYSDSPRIGLPVDEFECSRTLANVLLFSHDRRMVDLVGKDAYIRWMDDQLIGASSRAEGLKIVSTVSASLANLYLTANAKKTKVLSLKEAAIHFHLDTNSLLDFQEISIKAHAKRRRSLVRELMKVWRFALEHENEGEWEKIQKRVYRLAGLTKARFLRKNSVRDIINTPTLAERVADYMRCSGTSAEYLSFIRKVLRHSEHFHQDVELLLTESLLRLEVRGARARSILRLATNVVGEVGDGRRHIAFAGAACLLILRFGDRRSGSHLRRCFSERTNPKPPQLIRAAAITYSTYGRKEFGEVRRVAGISLSNPLALMVRMVWKLQHLKQVPDRFKSRLSIRLDSVKDRHYIDMRTVIAARLLRLNRRKSVLDWLKSWVNQAKKRKISAFDGKLLKNILR